VGEDAEGHLDQGDGHVGDLQEADVADEFDEPEIGRIPPVDDDRGDG
jgi:hypothetical protein